MSELDVVKIEYEYLPVVNGYIDYRLSEQLNKLLTINEDKNVIYICKPKDIFNYLVSDKETGEIILVEWDNINELRMFSSNNNYRYAIMFSILWHILSIRKMCYKIIVPNF